MHYRLRQNQKTAKGVLSLLCLAVLFLSGLTVGQLFTPGPAQAVGCAIGLQHNDGFCVSFGHLPREVGLSVSSDSIPMLRTNLRVTQAVLVQYKKGFVQISERHGDYQLRKPLFVPVSAYTSASNRLHDNAQWRRNLGTHFLSGSGQSRGLFEWEIPVKFPKVVSRIIGEGGPALKVSGYRRISFSGRSTWEDGLKNTATSRQSKFPSLNMEQYSSFTITGTIGSKISVKVDQDSRRHTDLENTLQLRYKGEEDEIIQSIEAGNTNLSVGSGVVGYGERKQGLFGIKTTAKIGGWDLTMITSQDKGSNQKAEFNAGAESKASVIRDYEYLGRTFYDLGLRDRQTRAVEGFAAGDSIVEIKLYKNNTSISSNTAQDPAPFGNAYVDPSDTSASHPEGSFRRRFQEVDPNDYFVQRNQHWIQFYSQIGTNDILAVYYEVLRSNGSIDTVGVLKDSCTSAEEETCMTLKLIKPETPKPDDYTWYYEWKNVYYLGARNIERDGFALDIYRGPDNAENVTEDPNYQDSTLYLRMFGLDELDLNAEFNPDGIVDYKWIDFGLGYLIFPLDRPFSSDNDLLADPVDTIYTSDRLEDRREQSRYYIHVQSSSRSSQFQLGHAPIIEGSDVVTLNGRPLIRGEDYMIMYEIGEITFMNPEALSPTANLTVDYEYAPLLMPEKKSVFGAMANYDLGSNFKFGAVGIYKSEKTADERPRVGQEPVRNFIWGSNLSFNSSPAFITGMFNAVPWIDTDVPSAITFRGDVAQSIPNPNTKNHAFIDDFEGSLEYTDLGIRRGGWTLSSPPVGMAFTDRCRMWWYNPYDQVPIQEIWPNKDVERNQEKTNVLHLHPFPGEPHRPSNSDFDPGQPERNWNGVMRPLYPGAYDQTRTKFLEVWVKGDKGILYVDLGEISEDLDGDRVLDTEDKPRNGQRDGILDDDEDLGLDTLDNDQERDLYSSTLSDPAGDDWNYDDRYDYSNINGTQGNREDPDRGRRPDTEDINSNSVLDLTDNYFQFAVDLSSDEFLADPADTSGGWRLYRVPLKDPQNFLEVGAPDWTEIRFARLWVGCQEECLVEIASIQLVGNRWENMGVSSLTSRQSPLPVGTPPNEEFDVFVKNTHEDLDYYPPEGIAGTLDRRTHVREKEQSLVLKYENLKPNHQGTVYRILYKPEDYTSYRYLKMFVHGPEDDSTSILMFFLKLGADSSNYYEYRTRVYPGWDGRNEVLMDFDQITGLKARAQAELPSGSRDPIDKWEGPYHVRGSPALNRIRWFSLGVVNTDDVNFLPASGEVWVDELRVTDIRKEKGIKGKLDVTAKLAGLADLRVSFGKSESQFRSLTQKKEGTESTTDYNINVSGIQVHKFLPVSLGYKFPVSVGYTKTLNLPKWKRGSDIVLPKELRDKEKTESVTKSFTFSPSFDHPTQHWLVGATLRRMSHSFNYRTSRKSSPLNPLETANSTGISAGYNVPLGRGLSVKPFGWLKGALVPKSFTQMSFSFLPTTVSVGGSFSEARSHRQTNLGEIYNTMTRNFTGNMNVQASPIKSIPITYNMTTARDIRDPETVIWSINPKEAKLGIETGYTESFSARYTPSWLSFLSANFSFDSKYNENADKLDSYNFGGTRTVSNSNNRSASFTLDWQKILGRESQKPGEKKSFFTVNPLTLLRRLTQRLDAVKVSYRKNQSFSKSGLTGRPELAYRLGFTDVPGVGRKGRAQSTDRVTEREDYSAKSGLKLFSTHADLSYTRNVNRTITATEATKVTSTRFPDFGFALRDLGKLWPLKSFFTSFSYNFGYFKMVDERGSERTGETFSKKISENFSPLASISMTWKKGIQSSVKITRKVTTDENLRRQGGNRSVTKSYDNSVNITNKYSFSAPHGIKLPFLKKLKFKSSLSISANITLASRKTESSVGGQGFNVTQDNGRLSVTSNVSYRFSSQVNGGVKIGWIDTNDKKTRRKTHTRELGIWMEIRF